MELVNELLKKKRANEFKPKIEQMKKQGLFDPKYATMFIRSNGQEILNTNLIPLDQATRNHQVYPSSAEIVFPNAVRLKIGDIEVGEVQVSEIETVYDSENDTMTSNITFTLPHSFEGTIELEDVQIDTDALNRLLGVDTDGTDC
jgi:hypothetical protein